MTDIAADFEDALAPDEPDFTEKPSAPLDLDQATQWVAKVARARRLREEYVAAHQAAVARLNARLNERVEALAQQEEWYGEALAMFHKTAIAVDPEALTIPTPAGTLKSTKTQPKWEFFDEAAFTAWALENAPEVIAEPPPPPAPKVVKTEVKKALKADAEKALKVAGTSDAVLTHDGAPVPGLRVLPAGRNFKIVTD
jgi:hypothetical protein